MALRLVKHLRKATVFNVASRGRPGASEEIVECPHDYYLVKDYEKNPYYMSLIHATRPGYKKDYDPFKKYSERREANWEPRYKHQQLDMSLGWFTLAYFILLPIEYLILSIVEERGITYYQDPLSIKYGKPSEF